MIRLRVLGSLELGSDDGAELRIVLAQPKRAALLAYLAAAMPAGFHRRERLLALFWPELDDAHARDALNAAVRFLRREMGSATIVSRGSDEIGVDRSACWSDVSAFREAIEAGRQEEALSLYRGDFLDGLHIDGSTEFEEWVDRTRTQLRAAAARAARELAEQWEREENFTVAVSCARRAVDLSDGDERILRQLLEMLDRVGDRAGALIAYETFERRLATEFESEPAAETQAVIERIRHRAVAVATPPAAMAIAAGNRPNGTEAGPAIVRRGDVPRTMSILGSAAAGVAIVAAAWSTVIMRPGWSSLTLGETAQLTHAPGLELDPAISPDGKLIAYAAGDVRRMRIYVRPVSGGDAVQVSGEVMHQHRWPAWSPDGSQLAFLASEGDRGPDVARLFVVSPLGGARHLIAEGLTYSSTPVWSPGASPRIAYPLRDSIIVRDTKGGPPHAILARARMYESRALATSSSVWAIHSLAWSPDGRRLAFVSGNVAFVFGTTAFGNLGPSSIWTASVDGGAPVRVTTGPYTFASPVWTPDSRGILYVSNANGAGDVFYQATDKTGRPAGDARRLTTGLNADGISLSSDGTRLAYTLMNYRSNIVAAPITSGVTPASALRPVTNENQTIETVDITTDGNWLVFESNRSGRSHIYKMPTGGGEVVQLTNDPADDFAPKWSPDGARIAFHRREPSKDGLRNVYVMNADGGQKTQVTSDRFDDSYPNWPPDGKSLKIGRIPGGPMITVLSDDGKWSAPEPDTSKTRRRATGVAITGRGGSLYLQPPTGPRRLLVDGRPLGAQILYPRVGADPNIVYFRAIDSAGVHSFYSIPVTGGVPRLVLRLDDLAGQPARLLFSTDGRALYFTRTQAESDIWIVSLKR